LTDHSFKFRNSFFELAFSRQGFEFIRNGFEGSFAFFGEGVPPFEQDGFADVVFSAELGWAFFAVDNLLDEFEFEFWSIFCAAHDFSFGKGIPRSFRRGYWSQGKGFTSDAVVTKFTVEGVREAGRGGLTEVGDQVVAVKVDHLSVHAGSLGVRVGAVKPSRICWASDRILKLAA
jgi:hypothetical protein